MNPLLKDDIDFDDLLSYYFKRAEGDKKNINRVKRFYTDEDGFNILMNRLIAKDFERFQILLKSNPEIGALDLLPNPWRFFYVVLEIALNEGVEVPPYDVLTNMFPSKTVEYMGWTFSWVHGESSLISIFNRQNELVYRF